MIKRNEKGSITLFTLIAMMFFLTIAFTAYVSAMARLQAQNDDLERIKASYEQDLTPEGLASLYEKLTTKVGKYAGEVLKTDANATEPEKKSPYVEYDGNLYRVLYDTSSPYGIELISNSTIGDPVVLGRNDSSGDGKIDAGTFGSRERAIWSYTNAVEILNKAAEVRVDISDGVVAYVRCVGSRPENKNFKVTEKYSNALTPNSNTSYFPEIYNNLWEQGEQVSGRSDGGVVIDNSNDAEDWSLIKKLNINVTSNNVAYWFSSRNVYADTNATYFSVNHTSPRMGKK